MGTLGAAVLGTVALAALVVLVRRLRGVGNKEARNWTYQTENDDASIAAASASRSAGTAGTPASARYAAKQDGNDANDAAQHAASVEPSIELETARQPVLASARQDGVCSPRDVGMPLGDGSSPDCSERDTSRTVSFSEGMSMSLGDLSSPPTQPPSAFASPPVSPSWGSPLSTAGSGARNSGGSASVRRTASRSTLLPRALSFASPQAGARVHALPLTPQGDQPPISFAAPNPAEMQSHGGAPAAASSPAAAPVDASALVPHLELGSSAGGWVNSTSNPVMAAPGEDESPPPELSSPADVLATGRRTARLAFGAVSPAAVDDAQDATSSTVAASAPGVALAEAMDCSSEVTNTAGHDVPASGAADSAAFASEAATSSQPLSPAAVASATAATVPTLALAGSAGLRRAASVRLIRPTASTAADAGDGSVPTEAAPPASARLPGLHKSRSARTLLPSASTRSLVHHDEEDRYDDVDGSAGAPLRSRSLARAGASESGWSRSNLLSIAEAQTQGSAAASGRASDRGAPASLRSARGVALESGRLALGAGASHSDLLIRDVSARDVLAVFAGAGPDRERPSGTGGGGVGGSAARVGRRGRPAAVSPLAAPGPINMGDGIGDADSDDLGAAPLASARGLVGSGADRGAATSAGAAAAAVSRRRGLPRTRTEAVLDTHREAAIGEGEGEDMEASFSSARSVGSGIHARADGASANGSDGI